MTCESFAPRNIESPVGSLLLDDRSRSLAVIDIDAVVIDHSIDADQGSSPIGSDVAAGILRCRKQLDWGAPAAGIGVVSTWRKLAGHSKFDG